MAGARFKQGQVKGAIAGHRSKATLVYCAEDVEEGDILCVTGVNGDFLQVHRAQCGHTANIDASIGTIAPDSAMFRGPYFVADYTAPTGHIGPVAVQSKIITRITTSDPSNSGVFTYDVTPGHSVLMGANGKTRLQAMTAFDGDTQMIPNIQAGHVVVSGDSNTGKVLLEPGKSDCVPIHSVVQSKADGSSSATLTLGGAPSPSGSGAVFAVSNNADLSILRAFNNSGTITITLSGSPGANKNIYFNLQR